MKRTAGAYEIRPGGKEIGKWEKFHKCYEKRISRKTVMEA